jgi:hypothetical protein
MLAQQVIRLEALAQRHGRATHSNNTCITQQYSTAGAGTHGAAEEHNSSCAGKHSTTVELEEEEDQAQEGSKEGGALTWSREEQRSHGGHGGTRRSAAAPGQARPWQHHGTSRTRWRSHGGTTAPGAAGSPNPVTLAAAEVNEGELEQHRSRSTRMRRTAVVRRVDCAPWRGPIPAELAGIERRRRR